MNTNVETDIVLVVVLPCKRRGIFEDEDENEGRGGFPLVPLVDVGGAKPKDVQQIPPALADLFAEVATTCRNADTFLAEKGQVTSPLLQVRSFERAQEWMEKLNGLQRNSTDCAKN